MPIVGAFNVAVHIFSPLEQADNDGSSTAANGRRIGCPCSPYRHGLLDPAQTAHLKKVLWGLVTIHATLPISPAKIMMQLG
jgi:hypothetical protein